VRQVHISRHHPLSVPNVHSLIVVIFYQLRLSTSSRSIIHTNKLQGTIFYPLDRTGIADAVQSTFLVFLLVFEVGSAVCGSAQSSKALIVGRAVAGLGGSGIMNGALTIISASSPMDKQPRTSLVPFQVFLFYQLADMIYSHGRDHDGM
jgi:MFS family permease